MLSISRRYPDLVVVILAAPIGLLLGMPVEGYAIGAAAWLLLRWIEVTVDRRSRAVSHVAQQVALRLSYRLTRSTLLVGAAVLALRAGRGGDGLTALAVIGVAFTVHLLASLCRGRAAVPASSHGAGLTSNLPRAIAAVSRSTTINSTMQPKSGCRAVTDREPPG